MVLINYHKEIIAKWSSWRKYCPRIEDAPKTAFLMRVMAI
jgi:hypothetical protein